nr:hypothetical protein [Tanacetum cinerariifolium]
APAGALDEEHAIGTGRFAELAGRDALQVLALFEALAEFAALELGPGDHDERQGRHHGHDRQAEGEHRRDPARERLAGG